MNIFEQGIPIGMIIRVQRRPAYCCQLESEPAKDPWYHDIKNFLKNQEYLERASSIDRKTLRRLAGQFFLSGETLYKRSPDMGLLRCVGVEEAIQLMKEVHGGICGPHMSDFMLAKKILRTGYFWLTMESDCMQFVRRCHKCQIHGEIFKLATRRSPS